MATKNPAKQGIKDNAPEGMALSDSELKAARKEGAKEDAKEIAKDTHRFMTDGNLPGEPTNLKYHGHEETQQWAYLLDGSLDAFKDRLKAKDDSRIPDNKAYGLLALERNGKNRTEWVKALMDHLDLDADELPGGGPDHTNDTTQLSKLR